MGQGRFVNLILIGRCPPEFGLPTHPISVEMSLALKNNVNLRAICLLGEGLPNKSFQPNRLTLRFSATLFLQRHI